MGYQFKISNLAGKPLRWGMAENISDVENVLKSEYERDKNGIYASPVTQIVVDVLDENQNHIATMTMRYNIQKTEDHHGWQQRYGKDKESVFISVKYIEVGGTQDNARHDAEKNSLQDMFINALCNRYGFNKNDVVIEDNSKPQSNNVAVSSQPKSAITDTHTQLGKPVARAKNQIAQHSKESGSSTTSIIDVVKNIFRKS